MTNVYVDWFPLRHERNGLPKVGRTNVRPANTQTRTHQVIAWFLLLMSTVAFPWTTKSVVPERQPL